jgi:hypothetical protein
MSKRLFVVTLSFVARHVSGEQRTFEKGEELLAEPPIEAVADIVLFEQDNEQFEADAKTFLASTVPEDDVDGFLDQPSPGDPRSPKCKRCGHLRAEHKNRRGACTAMKVHNNRQVPCDCRQFEPISSS